jgi:hypothetical protein
VYAKGGEVRKKSVLPPFPSHTFPLSHLDVLDKLVKLFQRPLSRNVVRLAYDNEVS